LDRRVKDNFLSMDPPDNWLTLLQC
jgi:hypothetical protein